MDIKTYFSLGYVRVLLTLILIGVVVALGAYAHYTLKQARYVFMGPTIVNVVGDGEVFAKPDVGQFTFGVMSEGEDAASAQSQSAEKINDIMAFLKEQGVEEKDIKTANYNLNPKYRYEERVCPFGTYCPPGEQIIDGYEVSQTVEVKVRNLDNSGDLISGAGERGATNLSGLTFTIDDDEAIKAEAREKAIVNARAKADQLAEDLGVRIVRMTGYWEDEGSYPMYEGYGGDMKMMDAANSVSPELPTGENLIKSRVNLSFEVK